MFDDFGEKTSYLSRHGSTADPNFTFKIPTKLEEQNFATMMASNISVPQLHLW
jgi:hypothetical protein